MALCSLEQPSMQTQPRGWTGRERNAAGAALHTIPACKLLTDRGKHRRNRCHAASHLGIQLPQIIKIVRVSRRLSTDGAAEGAIQQRLLATGLQCGAPRSIFNVHLFSSYTI